MRAIKVIALIGIALAGSIAGASDKLYSANAKDQGKAFDLVVTEAKREPAKSFLSIPGFHKRSAAGSRWLICAYADLAIKRGFRYWSAVYPDKTNETIVLGFYQSADADVAGTLGADYVAARVMPPTPVSAEAVATRLCGMRG